MKPYVQLAEARLRDGTVFSLHKHDGKFYLKNDRRELMSTRLTFSEQQLAERGCSRLLPGESSRPKHPRVLIGGLGMGFTLKKTLELVGSPATVEVAELVPEIVEWNRSFLVEHNGPLLEDERTRIFQGDLFDCLGKGKGGGYDAILIDIDDGPEMLITEGNSRLYTAGFLQRIRDSLLPVVALPIGLLCRHPSSRRASRRPVLRLRNFPRSPMKNPSTPVTVSTLRAVVENDAWFLPEGERGLAEMRRRGRSSLAQMELILICTLTLLPSSSF